MKIKVYVISVNKSSNLRRDVISKHLNKLGVDFLFFDATEGSRLDTSWIEQNVSQERKELFYSGKYSWLTVNQLGCADSHRRLANKLIESDEDAYLVLEDDVELDQKFFKKISLEDCLISHDLVLLNHSSIARYLPNKVKDLSYDYSLRFYPREGCLNASAYLMNKKAARTIVNYQYPKIKKGADSWSFFTSENKEECALVWPRAASSGALVSSIRYTNIYRRILYFFLKIKFLRKIYYYRQRRLV